MIKQGEGGRMGSREGEFERGIEGGGGGISHF